MTYLIANHMTELRWILAAVILLAANGIYNILKTPNQGQVHGSDDELLADIASIPDDAPGYVDDAPVGDTIPKYIEPTMNILAEVFAVRGIDAKFNTANDGPIATHFVYSVPADVKAAMLETADINSHLSRAVGRTTVLNPFIEMQGKIRVTVQNPDMKPVMWDEYADVTPDHNRFAQFPIGKDTTGAMIWGDLVKYKHMLVAGVTESGKSVWTQGVLNYLMLHYTPKRLRLVLFDLKGGGIEMGKYGKIPHLAGPVVTSLNDTPAMLMEIHKEMNRRYDVIRETTDGVNIQDYLDIKGRDAMPIMLIVVDELAQLTRLDKGKFNQAQNKKKEACVKLLTDLVEQARGVGIYVMACTQHPLAEIIPTSIKNNMLKVTFKCSTDMQSKVARDDTLASNLIGHGHGIVDRPGTGHDEIVSLFFDPKVKRNETMRILSERVACEMDLPLAQWQWRANPCLTLDQEVPETQDSDEPAVTIVDNVFVEAERPYDPKLAQHRHYQAAMNYVRSTVRAGGEPCGNDFITLLKHNTGRGMRTADAYNIIRQIMEHELNDEAV